MLKLYGIKTCDTCRKAKQALEKNGVDVEFIDVRLSTLDLETYADFAQFFGEQLVNRKSKTWRNLSKGEQELGIPALVAQFPTVMKRPVIINGEIRTIGWDQLAQKQHLGKADSKG